MSVEERKLIEANIKLKEKHKIALYDIARLTKYIKGQRVPEEEIKNIIERYTKRKSTKNHINW